MSENLSADIIKLLFLLLSGGASAGAYKLAVAYLERHKNKELRLKVGEAECIIKGHSSDEEARIIQQLSRKVSSKLLGK